MSHWWSPQPITDQGVRLWLAVCFGLVFLITIMGAMTITFWPVPGRSVGEAWLTMKELLAYVVPAETGIIGTIIGFYFGTRNQDATQRAVEATLAAAQKKN